MDSHRMLEVAGDAACLLEEMGFTSVARLKDGTVVLELWRPVGGEQRAMRRVVEPSEISAKELADQCAAAFRAGVAVR